MPYHYKSERLGFRQWADSDIGPFTRMCQDGDVMKYFPSLMSPKAVEELVERIKKGIVRDGTGFFAVELLESRTFIGFIGIKYQEMEADFCPCYEIGWRLDKEYWNQGLATEGAKVSLAWSSQTLGVKEVFSFTPKVNLPSERVMQKIGMKMQGYFLHPLLDRQSHLSEHVLYKITL